jgi:hypothetical protein
VQVFGHQAGGVLHWHAVTGKRHHAGAQFKVQRMQRGVQQFRGGGGVRHSGLSGGLYRGSMGQAH